jgi:hypothetical protein
MIRDIEHGIPGWDNFIDFAGLGQIFVTSVKHKANEGLIGKNLIEIGEIRGKAPYNATFDLLYEEQNAVGMVDFYGLEEHIVRFMTRPEHLVRRSGAPSIYAVFAWRTSRGTQQRRPSTPVLVTLCGRWTSPAFRATTNLASAKEAKMQTMPMGPNICLRIEELAAITAEPGKLTRLFLTPEQKRASELVRSWMNQAGMITRTDAIGNLIGRYEKNRHGLPALVIGSHLDTVRDAGKYDGMLGVLTAIACVEELHREGARLPSAIEVVGFPTRKACASVLRYLATAPLRGHSSLACSSPEMPAA